MMFEEFLDLIERLRKLVSDYRVDLERSEALTRYCLVDPFLRAWGWNPEDPSHVRPEFATEAGRPDYALLIDNKPVIYVGVKALGKQEKIEQYINYCITTGVPYFITTDGVKWEVYDTHIPKPLPEKKITEWDIINDDPAEIIRKAFVIWRHNRRMLEAAVPLTLQHSRMIAEGIKAEGVPLVNVKVEPGRKPPYTKLIFPDNRSYDIRHWRDVFVAAAAWLIDSGKISKRDIPIKPERGRVRCMVNDKPVHEDGSKFRDPKRVGEYYVETNISSERAIKWAIMLLDRFGVDSSKVLLKA
ncbi:MAG: hypothetical protein QXG35_07470 [Nitrososphaerota archaeon]